MKNTVLQGSLILIFAGFVCKGLGAVYRIPLSGILGAEGIGIYQMVFALFALFLIVSSGGISLAISHYVAKIRATGEGSIKNVLFCGLGFSAIVSVLIGALMIVFAPSLAKLQGAENFTMPYVMCAITLVLASLLPALRGLFQGFQNMMPTAISQVIEQSAKVALGLGFALFFVQYGLQWGVFGAFLGIAISEMLAFVYLLFAVKKVKFEVQTPQKNVGFWRTNFSITVGLLVIPLIAVFDSFVVVNLLASQMQKTQAIALYGLQSGIVSSLINVPVMLSMAISLALLPKLSFSLSNHQTDEAAQNFANVLKVLLFLLVPFLLIFVFFAKDIMLILYPSLGEALITTAARLLQISAIEVLFLGIVHITTSVFQSQDAAQVPVIVLAISAGIKCVLTVLWVSNPQFNIFGMALANLLFYAISAALLLFFAKKRVPFALDGKFLLVQAASTAMFAFGLWFASVYFESILAKILFVGASGLFLYALPMFFADFLGIKTFAKNWFKARRV